MRNLYAILGLVLFGFVLLIGSRVNANAASDTQYQTPLATKSVTRTPQPTATVNWQGTAQVAQATADEARRVNAEVTLEWQKGLNLQAQLTAESNQRDQQRAQWTATAAVTSIPLTATAQAMNGTAIAKQQSLQAAQMTATYQAPQILRDMKYAEAYNGTMDFWIRVWAFGMFGVFAIAVPAALFYVPRKTQPTQPKQTTVTIKADGFQPLPVEPKETVIKLQRTGAFPTMDKLTIPCNTEQWDAFVRGVILEGLSLAFNNWEGASSPFTREEYAALRNWMQANKMAQSTGQGALILSARGEEVMRGWIDAGELPTEYSFVEANEATNAD